MKMDAALWIHALLHSNKTLQQEKKNASFLKAIKNILLAALIAAGINILYLFAFQTSVNNGLINGYLQITITLLNVIISPIPILLASIILFILAKLLGGKGDFTIQFYLTSLFYAPLLVLSTIYSLVLYNYGESAGIFDQWAQAVFASNTGVISLIPNLMVFIIVPNIFWIYGLFLFFLTIKEVHNFSFVRAAIVCFIPIVLCAILLLIQLMAMTSLVGQINSMATNHSENTSTTDILPSAKVWLDDNMTVHRTPVENGTESSVDWIVLRNGVQALQKGANEREYRYYLDTPGIYEIYLETWAPKERRYKRISNTVSYKVTENSSGKFFEILKNDSEQTN